MFANVTLHTSRLILREFMEDDAAGIQVYAGDPEVTRFTSWGPNTPDVSAIVLAGWLKDQKSSPAPNTRWPLCIGRIAF